MTKSSGTPWWIVPLVIIGLILVAWFVTSKLPFDRSERVAERRSDAEPADPAETGTLEPVEEGTTTATPNIADGTATIDQTGTAVTSTSPTADPRLIPPATGGTLAPAPEQTATVAQPTPAAPPRRASPPPRVATRTPAPVPTPAPAPHAVPPPQTSSSEDEITVGEAVSIARRYIVRNDYYDTHPDCLVVRSVGYVNVGFTLEAWDNCPSRGGTRRIGVWRVDAKTGEVFRQYPNGRFLRP